MTLAVFEVIMKMTSSNSNEVVMKYIVYNNNL